MKTILNISQILSMGMVSVDFVSIIVEVVLMTLLVLYAIMLFTSRLDLNKIKYYAIAILMAGTALYFYGFSLEEVPQGVWSTLMRSLLSSIELFVSHTDLLEIEEAQHQPFFMELFIFIYACAVITSISALVSMFGKRTMSKIYLRLNKDMQVNHIFLGINHNTILLARSLQGTIDKEKERIVFIQFPDKEVAEKMSFGHLLHNMTAQNKANDSLEEYGIDTSITIVLQAKVDLTSMMDFSDILKDFGLKELKPLLSDKTAIYLISNDIQYNMKSTFKLVKDPFLTNKTIHCLVGNDGQTHLYEASLYNTGVHFMYPSNIAVQQLILNGKYHPCNTMEVATNDNGRSLGYVKGNFNAMVIGFGHIGKAATKFIYEYASVLGEDGNVIPFNIYIEDEKMDTIMGDFVIEVPNSHNDPHFHFSSNDAGTVSFWKHLYEIINDLNYVMITLEDDKRSVLLAGDIYRFAYKARKNGLKNFRIIVQIFDLQEEDKNVLNFYNSFSHEETILTFGVREDIFIANEIVSNNPAGIGSKSYNAARENFRRRCLITGYDPKIWDSFVQKGVIGKQEHDYERYAEAMRQLKQNFSEAGHSFTKQYIGKGIEELFRKPAKELSDEEKKAIENIAKTEHARWCAKAKMSGYIYGTPSSNTLKRSTLLKPWNDLTEEEMKHRYVVAHAGLIRIDDNLEYTVIDF